MPKEVLGYAISHVLQAIEELRRLPTTDEILESIRRLEDVRQDLNLLKVREEVDEWNDKSST